jgi:arylsulfatase A-like enzyme
MIARYDGDVLYADTELGRLLAGLDALGLASTTAVLVTADHGEEFFEHGNWGHGQSVYNELIRVPLVLRLPDGGARAGA